MGRPEDLYSLFVSDKGMDTIVQKIITRAKKDRDVLALAYFGSFARGEKHRDVDICIFLMPKKYAERELSKKKMQYTQENEKYDIQIFQQLPVYIRDRIFREARFIYCADEDILYDLFFAHEREYEHFKPRYEDYLGAVADG